MKVSELFEATNSKGLQGGAMYKPGFDADKGQLRGSVKDWLQAMNATPQDVAKALARFKATPLFRNDAAKAGLEYDSRPAGEKNGTIAFKVNRKYPSGNAYKTTYLIYANGQIRGASESAWGKEYMGKLMSPKPRIKAGDPVGSIVMLYTAAFEELLAKWKKSSERMEKADAKSGK